MRKSERTKNSLMNIATSIFGQVLILVMNFLTRTVFIHTLGKSYLGINGLFSDILSMLALTELGLVTAINYKLYKPLAEGDQKRVRLIMKFYATAYRVVGLAILILGVSLIPFLKYLIKDYDRLGTLGINAQLIFVLYLLQSVSTYFFFASRSAVVRADQKMYLLTIAGYVITFLTNLTQIVILIFTKNFILYTVCVIVFVIIQNFVNAVIATRRYPYAFEKEKDRLPKSEVLDIFKDLGALFVFKINDVVLKATDNIVLSTFVGLEIVGMYSNYLMIFMASRSIMSRFYASVRASAGNLFAIGTLKEKYDFFEVMNFFSALFYGTACVGVAVCADEFISVWAGPDYVIAKPFALLIGIEVLFSGLKYNLGQIRNVSGAFRQMWYSPVIGMIVNILVSVGTVNYLGIYGVILGTIISDILSNFTVDPYILHKYSFEGYRPVWSYYLRNLKYALVLIAVGLLDDVICRNFMTGQGFLSFGVHGLICALSVPAVFYIVFRKRHECTYFVNLAKRILNRVFGAHKDTK